MKIERQTMATPLGRITYFTITNNEGARVVLSELGAGIISLEVPDRDGKRADVVIGYSDAASYIGDGPCAGKTPGRYANRIAAGRLCIDNNEYRLPINNGPNHLHGGPDGFQNQIWHGETLNDDTVVFSLESPDGDSGYPGVLSAKVTYKWDDQCRLTITYEATTDRDTVANLTNHTYWNLAGHNAGRDAAMSHELTLECSRWLPTDSTLVPTGELSPVAGTPMDFTHPKPVGRDINADFQALRYGKGYDNCWVADSFDGNIHHIATLRDPESGRRLDILTDQPAAQVYTGNWLTGSPLGKDGAEYSDYCAIAIECQGFPDAPNQPSFPSQLVTPSHPYLRHIIFELSAS